MFVPTASHITMSNPGANPPRYRAFDAAIFDFDGVLMNTIPLHYRSYRDLFATEGVAFSFEDYLRTASGASRDRVIRTVLGAQIAPEKFEALMRRKQEIVLDLARTDGLKPIDGAFDLVGRLRQLGLGIGMGSSSRTAALFLATMQLDHFFDATTDALETKRSKPDPEVFLTTARKLGVSPARCLVFEDADVGVEAGKAAGMTIVAITTTRSAAVLHEADLVIDNFAGFDPEPILFPGYLAKN